MHIRYWSERKKETDYKKDQDVEGLSYVNMREIGCGGTYLVDLTQDRGQWIEFSVSIKMLGSVLNSYTTGSF
jgi:hypothetical protein